VRVLTSESLPAAGRGQFLNAVAEAAISVGATVPSGPAYAARPSPRSTALVNRLLASGAARVSRRDGRYLLEGHLATVRWEAGKLGVALDVAAASAGEARELRLPRVAVYAGQGVPLGESGEILWALDQGGFPYRLLDSRDFAATHVLEGVDVLVVPNGSAPEIVAGWNPEASNRKAPWEPAEPSQGIGEEGLDAVRRFVAAGGIYVGLGSGGAALAGNRYLGIAGVEFAPAAVGLGQVRLIATQPDSPLLFGYAVEAPVPAFIYAPPGPDGDGFAFRAPNGIVASYAGVRGTNEDQSFLTTEPFAAGTGNGAILHQRSGAGHVVLFGIAPAFRGQWRSTFGLLYNALYL
jgi:hypothetical protein